MHGDLSDTTLAAICRALAADAATGQLVLDGTRRPGAVTLQGGAVRDVRSPRPRARLAGRLAGGGHLDELTLARVLQDERRRTGGAAGGRTVADDIALARGLIERGLVDPLIVEDILVGQIVDGMVDLGTERTGRYRFRPAGHDGSAANVGPRLEVETLLEEVRRREDQLAALPRAALRPGSVPCLQTGRTDLNDHLGDHLGADAVTVLRAVDDQRSIEELAEALGYGAYDLACILSDLSDRGAVTLSAPAGSAGATPDDGAAPADGAAPDDGAASEHGPAWSAPHGPSPTAAPGVPGATTQVADGTRLAPGLADRIEGDTDVSEFLRELSWLAQGDDAPRIHRRSAAPADGATEPGDGHDDAPSAPSADGRRGAAAGPPRPRRDPARSDQSNRPDGQRRRRRLFGRGG